VKKSEKEAHWSKYQHLIDQARDAQRNGLYIDAVAKAHASWEHIDGMMQHEKQTLGHELRTIDGIEIVLEYAPLVLDIQKLGDLKLLLKSKRRIDKNTAIDIASELEEAFRRLWLAHRMWGYLEKNGEASISSVRKAYGGKLAQWRSITKSWVEMKLVSQTRTTVGDSFQLNTNLDRLVSAKCSTCGERVEGPKAIFLEDSTCPHCNTNSQFVIVAD
jgi:hypothetical protein